jgi:Mrp family chromosome partitioning ATPase
MPRASPGKLPCPMDETGPQVPIVSVASGKAGVGKTTAAVMQVAACGRVADHVWRHTSESPQ